MVRTLKRFGPTPPPSQRGHEKTALKRVTPFLMLTGVAGTGGSLPVFVGVSLFTLLVTDTYFFTGERLKKNLEDAWKFAKIQDDAVTTLSNALDPAAIIAWTAMMNAYHRDPSKPNPFKNPSPSKLFLSVSSPCAEYGVRCHAQ